MQTFESLPTDHTALMEYGKRLVCQVKETSTRLYGEISVRRDKVRITTFSGRDQEELLQGVDEDTLALAMEHKTPPRNRIAVQRWHRFAQYHRCDCSAPTSDFCFGTADWSFFFANTYSRVLLATPNDHVTVSEILSSAQWWQRLISISDNLWPLSIQYEISPNEFDSNGSSNGSTTRQRLGHRRHGLLHFTFASQEWRNLFAAENQDKVQNNAPIDGWTVVTSRRNKRANSTESRVPTFLLMDRRPQNLLERLIGTGDTISAALC